MTAIRLPATVIKFFKLLFALPLFVSAAAFAENTGDEVFVVYNTREPESKSVAEHYAEVRKVPKKQVLGLDMANRESVSRAEFTKELQRPLCKALEAKNLWHFEPETVPGTATELPKNLRKLTHSSIRYLVLCYGVPLIIVDDPGIHEDAAEKMPPPLRKNAAAVDSELACLPLIDHDMVLAGPMGNHFLACTNASLMNPTNGILLVTRLDGPTAAIARKLVDKAVEAETNGLWGRAYFDLRGITSGDYKAGDDWIRRASEVARDAGYETVVDNNGAVFPAEFPLSQVALYAGWYEQNVTGAFARPTVEFMPGAFAYHLHSFSAATIRSTKTQWVGPLLDRGVTATMGCVDEPYLGGTPAIGIFFERFIDLHFTFGEAAYAGQTCLSWQTTVVGDPLYCPFRKSPQELHEELKARHSPWLEWSYLQLVNMSLLRKVPLEKIIALIQELPLATNSAVLHEKLADLYFGDHQPDLAENALHTALRLDPTPQQRTRLTLQLADQLAQSGHEAEAYDLYDQFLIRFPDYPEPLRILRELSALAKKLGKNTAAENFDKKIAALTPPPA